MLGKFKPSTFKFAMLYTVAAMSLICLEPNLLLSVELLLQDPFLMLFAVPFIPWETGRQKLVRLRVVYKRAPYNPRITFPSF